MAEKMKMSDDDVDGVEKLPCVTTTVRDKDSVCKSNGRRSHIEPYRPGNGLLPKSRGRRSTETPSTIVSENRKNDKSGHDVTVLDNPPASTSLNEASAKSACALPENVAKTDIHKETSPSPPAQGLISEKDKKARVRRPDMELYKPKARLHLEGDTMKNALPDKLCPNTERTCQPSIIPAKVSDLQQRKGSRPPSSNSPPTHNTEHAGHLPEKVTASRHIPSKTIQNDSNSKTIINSSLGNDVQSSDWDEEKVSGNLKLPNRHSRRSASETPNTSFIRESGRTSFHERHLPRSRSVRKAQPSDSVANCEDSTGFREPYSHSNSYDSQYQQSLSALGDKSNTSTEHETSQTTLYSKDPSPHNEASRNRVSGNNDEVCYERTKRNASDDKSAGVPKKNELSRLRDSTACEDTAIGDGDKGKSTSLHSDYHEQQQRLKQLYKQQQEHSGLVKEAHKPESEIPIKEMVEDDWIQPKHILVPPLPASVWSTSKEEVKQTLVSLHATDSEGRRERRGRGKPIKEHMAESAGHRAPLKSSVEPLSAAVKEKLNSIASASVGGMANCDSEKNTSLKVTVVKAASQEDLSVSPKHNWERNCEISPLSRESDTSEAQVDKKEVSKPIRGCRQSHRRRNGVDSPQSSMPHTVNSTELPRDNNVRCDNMENAISQKYDVDPVSPTAKASSKLDWGEEVERAERVNEEKNRPEERVNKVEGKGSHKLTRSNRTTPTCEVETSDPESPVSPLKDRHTKTSKKKKKSTEVNSSSGHKRPNSRKNRDSSEVSRSSSRPSTKSGGIIHLPNHPLSSHTENMTPELLRPSSTPSPPMLQRHLFDPNNPSMPQIVTYQQNAVPHNVYRRQSDPYSGVSDMPSPTTQLCIDPHAVMYPQSYPGYCYPGYAVPHMDYYPAVPPLSPHLPADMRGFVNPQKLSNTQRNIREAWILENELNCYLAIPYDAVDQKKFGQCRWKIQLRYENAILSDVDFCTKHNIEQSLWKAAYYQVIETFRKQMNEFPHLKDDIRKSLLALIEEGAIFYENLLDKLQDKYNFSLMAFLDSEAVRPTSLPDHVKVGLISAQKMIICLGDLARYKEQANDTVNNFGKARNWYLKAQQLAPKNGRPYNQLAIIALHMKRKLDAVYYYMRSLAATTPFQTARESLISLFDEARKKYELVKKMRDEEREERVHKRGRDPSKVRCHFKSRQEVWVREDGTSSEQQIQPPDLTDPSDEELNSLNAVDLSKKFALSFLHTQGKLFTKIGMDTFATTAAPMLREFRFILKHRPLPMGSSRLVQIMAINMFIIHHTEIKGCVNIDELWSSMQMNALQLSLDMFAVMLHECLVMLKEHLGSSNYPATFLSDDIQELLPAIKVWCDWLMCHLGIWNPPPPRSDFCTSELEGDVWSLLAQLATTVKKMDLQGVELTKERTEGWEPVVLQEDLSLAGFVPLLGLPQDTVYTAPPCNKDLVHNVLRLQRLLFCADFLDGIEPPVLYYDVPRKMYVSLVGENGRNGSEGSDEELNSLTEYNSSQVEDSAEEAEEGSDERDPARERSEIDRLRSRKQELKRRKADQEKHKRQIQDVLHSTKTARTILLVHPRFLVPDTNCFIDHLNAIKQLVGMTRFRLVVPIVVVNELEGLARSGKTQRGESLASSEHNRRVVMGAKAGLDYLTQVFEVKHPHVKAVTSKGSELDTIAFRSEDNENVGTNDDLILRCCLEYCNTVHGGNIETDKDGVCRISRKIVLLTDDRHLRLKAITADVPTRDMPGFLHSAEISLEGD